MRRSRAGGAARRCSIGSTKAAVLPVPVWAPASRSRPSSTSGIASRWTGVGSVYPWRATARSRSGGSPRVREGQGRELLTGPSRDASVAGPGQGEKVSRDRTEMKPRRRPVRQSNTCAKCTTSIRCTLGSSPEHPRKAAMTDRCIHGFEEQHCASCRRCPHGILESRCATCSPRTAREATLRLANNAPRPSEEHRGYEISYVAGERSWYIRADADAPLSQGVRTAPPSRRAGPSTRSSIRPAPVAVRREAQEVADLAGDLLRAPAVGASGRRSGPAPRRICALGRGDRRTSTLTYGCDPAASSASTLRQSVQSG